MKRHAFVSPFVAAAAACSLLALTAPFDRTRADERVQPIPTDRDSAPAGSLRPYMQAKLGQSQAIVHGLVLDDLAEVARAADDLRATSQLSPEFGGDDLLDDEVYGHFQLEFVRLSTRLGELARNGNRDGAAHAYTLLTANCMSCHEYLRDRRADTEASAVRPSGR